MMGRDMQGMLKFLAVVLILGGGGYAIWARFLAPESRACNRLATLCDESLKDRRECVDDLEKLRKTAGEEAVARMERCIAEARSCAEAAGCAVGTTFGGFVEQFFRGMKRGLEQQK